MLSGDYLKLYNRLSVKIDTKRMFHDPLHTLAFGTDASFYRMLPKLVIKAKDEAEVSFILEETSQLKLPVTFRAAGTSLSGQAISDSVLIIAGEHWKDYRILDDGKKIRLQPGLRGSKVNVLLAPYRRKIGPDPASVNSAMIGGIVANNASGMCCGTTDNSYQAVAGMKIIFYDGTVLDTSSEQSKKNFSEVHPEIISSINILAQSVRANSRLLERILKKFSIKNTTGYGINALVNFSDPFDIIEHLMVGSEGTLGFISEVIFNTIADQPFKASAMIIFPGIEEACKAVLKLKNSPASTAELINRSGLSSVEKEPGMPGWITELSPNATTLLVETHADDKEALEKQIKQIEKDISSIPVEFPVRFTVIPKEYAQFWKIRKGLFPKIGALRETGTTVIIEDIALPVENLAGVIIDLEKLIKEYDYKDAVIYGHALAENIHFVFTQNFSKQEEVKRYENFMKDVADLVVKKYDGSLKAEHGTGRNMAPFVKFEWGEEAYEIMKQIKQIFDPQCLLNPGVIINEDEKAHLKNLKLLPPANEKIDKCIECGFCEPSCVSAELTLSPRQRITVLREINRLKSSGEEPHIVASLINQYSYSGDETCATDGLCALACPVKIDTGKMLKELRRDKITPFQQKTAMWIADHMNIVTSTVRNALSVVNVAHTLMGTSLMKGISGGMRKLSGNKIPHWTPAMPKGSKKMEPANGQTDNPDKVVYFPSCINRSMGKSKDYNHEDVQLTEKVQQLIKKAGFEVIFPKGLNDLCCGMAFSSKGFKEAGFKKSKELEEALWEASNYGQFPVLCDMSPCLFTMKENMEPKMKLYEPVEFILEYLVPKLDITPINEPISVFPVCSMKKMGLEEKLVQLTRMCANNVFVPETNCCGFAGDRGFSFPELNAHGLRNLKVQTPDHVKIGYSTSRTCEIGLTEHSGFSYKSIVYLVDQVSTVNDPDVAVER